MQYKRNAQKIYKNSSYNLVLIFCVSGLQKYSQIRRKTIQENDTSRTIQNSTLNEIHHKFTTIKTNELKSLLSLLMIE